LNDQGGHSVLRLSELIISSLHTIFPSANSGIVTVYSAILAFTGKNSNPAHQDEASVLVSRVTPAKSNVMGTSPVRDVTRRVSIVSMTSRNSRLRTSSQRVELLPQSLILRQYMIRLALMNCRHSQMARLPRHLSKRVQKRKLPLLSDCRRH
jgi:hypothetical protein